MGRLLAIYIKDKDKKNEGWKADHLPSTPWFTYWLFCWPACIDRLQGCIEVLRTSHIAGDFGPERTGSNLTRHQVGSVEAEAGRSSNELGNAVIQVRTV